MMGKEWREYKKRLIKAIEEEKNKKYQKSINEFMDEEENNDKD